ncbi:hypothetical protein E2C01_014195 [Portunus trituberculatus]|uniref:Uncharacterized protein n=1 Tax=Portunus trituberculatus TaxID=210409 RepID=A0A5B7DII9_PORTR|nr:hypothetical protein [Portunus trituberculatus]
MFLHTKLISPPSSALCPSPVFPPGPKVQVLEITGTQHADSPSAALQIHVFTFMFSLPLSLNT